MYACEILWSDSVENSKPENLAFSVTDVLTLKQGAFSCEPTGNLAESLCFSQQLPKLVIFLSDAKYYQVISHVHRKWGIRLFRAHFCSKKAHRCFFI